MNLGVYVDITFEEPASQIKKIPQMYKKYYCQAFIIKKWLIVISLV